METDNVELGEEAMETDNVESSSPEQLCENQNEVSSSPEQVCENQNEVSSSPEQVCGNQNEAEKTEIWKPYQDKKRKGEDINEQHRQTKRQRLYEQDGHGKPEKGEKEKNTGEKEKNTKTTNEAEKTVFWRPVDFSQESKASFLSESEKTEKG